LENKISTRISLLFIFFGILGMGLVFFSPLHWAYALWAIPLLILNLWVSKKGKESNPK
jgi:hypothetical protein